MVPVYVNTKTKRAEEDALAQAEIWMTIAAQSKKEGSSGTFRLCTLILSFQLIGASYILMVLRINHFQRDE